MCLVQLLLTALELATALAYLHSVDIMHGDLTGGNVLLHSAPVTPGDSRGFIVKVLLCHSAQQMGFLVYKGCSLVDNVCCRSQPHI